MKTQVTQEEIDICKRFIDKDQEIEKLKELLRKTIGWVASIDEPYQETQDLLKEIEEATR